jgi:hypothetical protein
LIDCNKIKNNISKEQIKWLLNLKVNNNILIKKNNNLKDYGNKLIIYVTLKIYTNLCLHSIGNKYNQIN